MLGSNRSGGRMVSVVAMAMALCYADGAFAQGAKSGETVQDSTPPPQPQAQTADTPPAGEIVVTGIRASLQSAVNIKRTATSIVDVISSEDMGSFPDQNIAESLQRVTGVQIQRDRAEGRDISIRGLDPKFSHITLNGDGLISIAPIANINPNGAPAPNRSFDFTSLGSDFVQTLVVSKSSTADQEEGGLAGSVDVRTVKPLDMKKNRLTFQAEGYRNTYAKKVGPHLTATYTGKFFGDTLGVAVGADFSKRYLQTQSYQSSGQDSRQENQLKGQGAATLYTNTGSLGAGANTSFVDWNGDGDNLDAYRFNHLLQFQQDEGKRTRQTYNLGLQWRPTSRLEVTFNGIYADYKSSFTTASYSFQNHLGGDPTLTGNRVVADHISSIQPFAGDFVGNGSTNIVTCPSVGVSPATGCVAAANSYLPIAGLVDYYDLRGALVDNITKINTSHTKTAQGQLGLAYDTGHVRLEARGSYDRSTRDSLLNAGMDAFSYKEVIYDQRTDLAGIPSAGYGAAADPLNKSTYNSGSGFFTGFIVPQKIVQKLGSADLTWHDTPFSWLSALKVGFKHGDMTLNQAVSNLSVSAASFATLSGDTLSANTVANGLKANGITLTNYMRNFGGSDFLSRYGGNSTFPTAWVGPDVQALLAKYPLSQLEGLSGAVVPQLSQSYEIREISNAAYARLDFALFDDKLSGNVGLRMVHTKSIASGYTGDPTTLYQVNASTLAYRNTTAYLSVVRDYWSTLPSLNLKYTPSRSMTFRAAASQTVTRPDFSNLVPSNGAISLVTQTATIANTNLKPYYSINLDLGGEFYFGQGGVFSVALFKKYIRGYYVNSTGTVAISYADLAGNTQNLNVATSQAVNGSSTTTKGVELAFQKPFTFLPGALSGFGTLLNYTFTDAGKISSGIAAGNIVTSFTLPYVSRHAANAVLYYEKYGLSVRGAYVWRSKYTEIAGGPGLDARGGSYVKAAGYLDFSSKYQITPQLAVTLDLANALDTAVERVNVYGFGRGYEVNGRTLTGGVRLAF